MQHEAVIKAIAIIAAIALMMLAAKLPRRKDAKAAPAVSPDRRFPGTVLTIAGTYMDFVPARNRVGCVMELTDGNGTGRYYVPLSPHDVRTRYNPGETVRFRIDCDTQPVDGIYDTIGNADRLWDI